MRKRNALIGLAVIVVAGGWYAFRPERLFVDRTVNESLVTTPDAMARCCHARTRALPFVSIGNVEHQQVILGWRFAYQVPALRGELQMVWLARRPKDDTIESVVVIESGEDGESQTMRVHLGDFGQVVGRPSDPHYRIKVLHGMSGVLNHGGHGGHVAISRSPRC